MFTIWHEEDAYRIAVWVHTVWPNEKLTSTSTNRSILTALYQNMVVPLDF